MVFPIRDKPGKKMKLISFERNKQQGFGAVIGDQVIDLTGQIQGASCLRELLENGALDEVALDYPASTPFGPINMNGAVETAKVMLHLATLKH